MTYEEGLLKLETTENKVVQADYLLVEKGTLTIWSSWDWESRPNHKTTLRILIIVYAQIIVYMDKIAKISRILGKNIILTITYNAKIEFPTI